MKRKKRIEKILHENFKDWTIAVIDVSYNHKGHNSFSGIDETHFSIILSPQKKNLSKRIDIHRKINTLLKKEFVIGLHALEIKIND